MGNLAMCVTPWCAEFPDQEAQRVKASSSGKRQASSCSLE